MNVFTIDGNLGTGKTLGMTLLSNYFQLMSNCSLFSNFDMRTGRDFHSYVDFLEVARQPSSIVLIDEAHTLIDSRNPLSNTVRFFTHLAFYLRKMRCTLFLTSPQMDSIDTRVRDLANIHILVDKFDSSFRYRFYDYASSRLVRTFEINKQLAFLLASSLYDSDAMVTPVNLPEKKEEFYPFMVELKKVSDLYRETQRTGAPAPDRLPLDQGSFFDLVS